MGVCFGIEFTETQPLLDCFRLSILQKVSNEIMQLLPPLITKLKLYVQRVFIFTFQTQDKPVYLDYMNI